MDFTNTEDLYARFNQLLEQGVAEHKQGDKVTGIIATCAAGLLRDCLLACLQCALSAWAQDKACILSVFLGLCRVDQRGAYVEIGGKMPAYCPIDELSMCKLSRVRLLLSPFLPPFKVLYGK